jgi:hypothetical protein
MTKYQEKLLEIANRTGLQVEADKFELAKFYLKYNNYVIGFTNKAGLHLFNDVEIRHTCYDKNMIHFWNIGSYNHDNINVLVEKVLKLIGTYKDKIIELKLNTMKEDF